MATSTMAMSTEPIGRERQRMDGIVGYARSVGGRVRHATVTPWSCAAALAVTAAISVWGIARIPDASPVPVLLALLPFAVGKYVLCPLRWHALSVSGRGRWWHLRAYAEGELLGLLSSVPASADLWRARRLHGVGLPSGCAVAEVALDRLVGMVGIGLAVALTGVAFPPRLLLAVAAIALVVAGVVLLVRRRRPELLARRPLPGPRVLARGLAFSVGYQATVAGLVFGAVAAVGHRVDPFALLTVFGASLVAGIVPGLSGANPRNGALAFGLTSLGVTWTAALGAVALVVLLPWAPALLFGGASFVARRLAARPGWRLAARSARAADLPEQAEILADDAGDTEPARPRESVGRVDGPDQHVLGGAA